MAKQKLFLDKVANGFKKVGNSMSTQYAFDGKKLTLAWAGETREFDARLGDCYVVSCNGKFPEVSKLKLPRDNRELLMWLCGFSKNRRFTSPEKFNDCYDWAREFYDWWGYREQRARTEGEFEFILCNRSDCGGAFHVVAWISNELPLTREKVLEILKAYRKVRWFDFPKAFTRTVLTSRFGFGEAEFAELKLLD